MNVYQIQNSFYVMSDKTPGPAIDLILPKRYTRTILAETPASKYVTRCSTFSVWYDKKSMIRRANASRWCKYALNVFNSGLYPSISSKIKNKNTLLTW